MNVYRLEAWGNYCGGIAVVAAPNPAIATEIGKKIDTGSWGISYFHHDKIEKLPVKYLGKLPRVITHFETGE